MQILRRAASTISAATTSAEAERQYADEGPFFDLDFSSCSVRASSSSGSSGSESDSDESCAELDLIISLQRSHSALPLKFCASETPARAANSLQPQQQHCARKRGIGTLRAMSFAKISRRCLTKISRRFRTASPSPRAATTAVESRVLRRLRKCRSASSAEPRPSSVTARREDSVVEKQDGIAGAIAHCKDSLHRASTSQPDTPLLGSSLSDPGNCEAA